jgi:hypothetical protein
MKNKISKMLKGTYLDRNTSLGVACLGLIGNSILIPILIGMGILLFVGPVVLILSLLFSWIGFPKIANTIPILAGIIPIVGGLTFCMGAGAEMGVKSFKEYLGLPFNELETTLDNLSFEKQNKLKQKISTYIDKCINEIEN